MRYEGSIYRPPSEAWSLIIQATIGCSHNKCSFCSMYKDKEFRIRKTEEILEDIRESRMYYKSIKRVFLADGDALMIKTAELLRILQFIKKWIPECERVGIYASPKSIMIKTQEELKLLKEAGLGIAYLGLESGSDKILAHINKGADSEDIVKAVLKIKDAGILLSVTLISGLGGTKLWKEHALESAKAISKMKPDYLGLLTLMIEPGTKLYDEVEKGEFELLTPQEVAIETLELLKNLDAEGCVFRSNHASNYLSLKGTLNKDKEILIKQLNEAIEGQVNFKDEYLRGL
ncbi:radical SAM protein [Lutispora thermophila]|uniref:Radical SAM superfamily protein n=1 Tax=Lutispora thermophila DSM 19022 TaxID=1122184 RepID=A0A1M6FUR1_9FIRM|nr:radical SAM protein [Lutispora thermophila]SHJ01410.1 Radical SAM superfamily protein [Lutispora thermophila DSM 19022]